MKGVANWCWIGLLGDVQWL